MPDLPTIAESGLPNYEFQAWYGLVAPAAVPRPIMVKLNRDVTDALKNPALRDAMMARGAQPMGGSIEEASRFIRQEIKKYAAVMKEAGIRTQ